MTGLKSKPLFGQSGGSAVAVQRIDDADAGLSFGLGGADPAGAASAPSAPAAAALPRRRKLRRFINKRHSQKQTVQGPHSPLNSDDDISNEPGAQDLPGPTANPIDNKRLA